MLCRLGIMAFVFGHVLAALPAAIHVFVVSALTHLHGHFVLRQRRVWRRSSRLGGQGGRNNQTHHDQFSKSSNEGIFELQERFGGGVAVSGCRP
jgi:hypothetical protein